MLKPLGRNLSSAPCLTRPERMERRGEEESEGDRDRHRREGDRGRPRGGQRVLG